MKNDPDTRRRRSLPTQPSEVAHFRVAVGDTQIALHTGSALHDVIASKAETEDCMTVRFQRAVGADRFLYNWYRDTRLGKNTTVPVTIMLLDGAGGEAIHRFGLENARPVRWTGPYFDALASAIAMEEIELRYDAVIWLAL